MRGHIYFGYAPTNRMFYRNSLYLLCSTDLARMNGIYGGKEATEMIANEMNVVCVIFILLS